MNVKKGLDHLRKVDKKMVRVIDEFEAPVFTKEKNYFEALVRAIVYQQLSGKAASTIYGRFKDIYRGNAFPSPKMVLETNHITLRSVGLSNQKSSYIHNIAEAFELSSRNLARATHYIDDKQKRKVEKIETRRTPTTADFEKVARKEPNDIRLQVDLARNYETAQRFEDAKEIYLKLAAQNPFNADAHFHLGSFYARFGQMTKARHAFDEAMDVQPNHRATIEAMATLFGSKEDRNLSDDVLAKSAERDPKGPAQRRQRQMCIRDSVRV